MIPGNANPLLLATAAADGAAAAGVATRSLRFDDGSSAYLSRTPSSAGNQKTFTWSGWIKRTEFGGNKTFFSSATSNTSNPRTDWQFNNDALYIAFNPSGSSWLEVITDRLFRDPSAWYHIVVAVDTAQGTNTDRVKVYVNGVRETSFSTYSTFTQNSDLHINSTTQHSIGRYEAGDSNYFPGYITDLYIVDGLQLDATSFGAFDSSGVWQAAAYSGTFGTNGFHLKFDDTSSNAALGTDSSGNDNDFTVYNLVASAPATAKGGFDVVTYTGTGSTQSISGLKFQPDFVWIRQRDASRFNVLFDSVRGANERLISNSTAAESTQTDHLSAFTSDGFTVQTSANVNVSSGSYVAWAWKAGGTAVSNTDGSITSSVSASTDYGFSIVSYTGTGANATVGHGLNTAPAWIIVKRRDDVNNWRVGHDGLTDWSYRLNLETTGVQGQQANVWNSTAPTSSVFSIGTSSSVNYNTGTYVAYCWSEVTGFSSFGSYEGDGDGTGPDVTTGFKPKYVIIKNIDEAAGWRIYDSVRGTSKVLKPNTQDTELTTGDPIVFLSDGFRLTGTTNEETNKSGQTYIYAAFSGEPPGDLVDSLFDAPTNGDQSDTGAGGEVSGNYATLNPLASNASITLSNGNLDSKYTTGAWVAALGSIGVNSGKWYWEMTLGDATNHMYGVAYDQPALNSHNTTMYGYYNYDGSKWASGVQGASYGSSSTTGDVIGVALDLSAGGTSGTITFYKNGTSMGAAFSNLDCSKTYVPWVLENGNTAGSHANFGQRAFAYTAPSGFSPLCTTLLPTPTIADGSDYFEAKTYTGNSSTNSITGLSFSPDFVWIKNRVDTDEHMAFDTIRGVLNRLNPSVTNTELSQANTLTAFNSDGFTLGSDGQVNQNTQTYIAWTWDAGSSTVSNTDGSITSSVRASQTAGFSIVSYTGNATTGTTVGHGLNAAPELIIIKNRDQTYDWYVFGDAIDSTFDERLTLNSSAAKQSSTSAMDATAPTSSVFTVGNNAGTNGSGNDMIALCFSPVANYSAIGSYQGNGSSDGTFVYTGFKIAFLLIKRTDAASSWYIFDSARSPFNAVDDRLRPHTNAIESSGSAFNHDFLSNGFKMRTTEAELNNNGSSYIYAAFSENPFSSNGGLAR